MIFSVKKLTKTERVICEKTISSKAMFALVGDAIMRKEKMSLIRMGDGERHMLTATDETIFVMLEARHPGWRKRLGVKDLPLDAIKELILDAGNSCTYFAPSVSGISFSRYNLYDFFAPRPYYIDNFFVNDWTKGMIQSLLDASDGVFVLHSDYKKIIQNFQDNYGTKIRFDGFQKNNWKDNERAIEAAMKSDAQLIFFSAGPAGKVIGPKIASAENKIVIDVGNTLLPWSEKTH